MNRGQEKDTGGEKGNTSWGSTDAEIVRQLAEFTEREEDYWAFRRRATRGKAHGLTQYPAMMVPSMQEVLVRAVATADGGVSRVLDPYAGAGTTLVECMRLGMSYAGQDINPLAVLLCRTKVGPFHTNGLGCAAKEVVDRANADRGKGVEADFPGLGKWFCPKAIAELSRLRRAIQRVDHTWYRRVLWTGLAETVRRTSNSRTSTFKLHMRRPEELRSREVHPLATFATVVADIGMRLQAESRTLRKRGHLHANGCYRGHVVIRLGDSAESVPSVRDGYDLLITSPPYGDNPSTVPYGQYSYLPLQWIDLHDIDPEADPSYLRSTHEIDSRSIGGSRRNAIREVKHLLAMSPSLSRTLHRLEEAPADRGSRVAAFYRDLDRSLGPVLEALRPKAYMIWTVGNRRVGAKPVPTDTIIEELLVAKGSRLITKIERRIPSKRMATRNSIATTMRKEAILLFRKV